MTENKFAYGENDYVSLKTATDYLHQKYDITYNTVRRMALHYGKLTYIRAGYGTKSKISILWGSILRWEKQNTVEATDQQEDKE